MAKTSTLGSPGVEVNEIDNSLRTSTSTACTAYLSGFASQGTVEEVNRVSNMTDFVNIYGEPTNAAERYFYYQAKAFLDGTGAGATLLTSRLPYGKGKGNNVSSSYTVMAYPAIPIIKNPEKYSTQPVTYYIAHEDEVKLFQIKDGDNNVVASPSAKTVTSIEGGDGTFKITGITATKSEGKANKVLTLKYKLDDEAGCSSCEDVTIADKTVKAEFTIANGWKVSFEVVYPKNAKIGYLSNEEDTDSFVLGADPLEKEISVKPSHDPAEQPRFIVAKTFSGETSFSDTEVDVDEKYFEVVDDETVRAKDVTYLIGAPVTFHLSYDKYIKLVSGEELNWEDEIDNDFFTDQSEFTSFDNIGKFAFVVVNTAGSIINEEFEGYYIGMSDNAFVNPATDGIKIKVDDKNKTVYYNAVDSVKVTTSVMKGDNEQGLFDNDKNTGSFSKLNTLRLGFDCEGNNAGSISRILERSMTPMDISSTDYDDTLSIGLFKLNKSTNSTETMKLSYSLHERFNGAFGQKRLKSSVEATKPVSYFIEKIVADDSNNIGVIVNTNISSKIKVDVEGELRGKIRVYGNKILNNLEYYESIYDANEPAKEAVIEQVGFDYSFFDKELFTTDTYFQKLDSLYPIGVYTTVANTSKVIGNLPYKLQRSLELVENDEEYTDLDLVIDGGLSTIYAYSKGHEEISKTSKQLGEVENPETTAFVDTAILTGIEDLRTGTSSFSNEAHDIVEDYLSIINTFLRFCNSQASGGRGDSFFIGDILRGIAIKGKNTKVTSLYGQTLTNSTYKGDNNEVTHNWSTSIYYPIKHTTDSIVSTYASLYAQWFKEDDVFSGQKVWLPSSAYVAASMAATDVSRGPWYAAAGYNRGVITGPIDYALNPTPAQRTDLYKICINSIPKQPNAGVTIWGIRTMSKKPTAFDQNTCRRTFLYMEKKLKQLLRYYVFEPNTTYTRLNIYNDIKPFMDSVKDNGGIYSYKIRVDESNNTPELINNGDLAVDVSAAPTRTAENIILNMTANRYAGDVSVS